MNKFSKGDKVFLPGHHAVGVVTAVRGRSNPDWEGLDGYVKVVALTGPTHVKVGDSLFAGEGRWIPVLDIEEVS